MCDNKTRREIQLHVVAGVMTMTIVAHAFIRSCHVYTTKVVSDWKHMERLYKLKYVFEECRGSSYIVTPTV